MKTQNTLGLASPSFISLSAITRKGLAFIGLLVGFYAISWLIPIFAEGPLSFIAMHWLITESVFFLIAFVLYLVSKSAVTLKTQN